MNVTIEEISDTRKKLVVSIPASEREQAEKETLKSYQRQANLPGFRKGKAPEHLLRQRYGKEMKEDVRDQLLRKSFKAAQDESKLDIYGIAEEPKLNLDDDGGDGELVCIVDINPEFELPAYKDLELKVVEVVVRDEDVDTQIKQMAAQQASFDVVEGPANKGDYVKVSYEGKIDDKPIAELAPDRPIYGKQANTWEEAGAEGNVGVAAVVEGVLGMQAGDSKQADMTFPDDFEEEALRGKAATYSITVHEVRSRTIPEIDDTFAAKAGKENLQQMKDELRKDLEARFKQQRKQTLTRQVEQHLADSVDFSLPESAIEEESNNVLRQIMSDYLQRGAKEEELQQHKDELFQQADKIARRRLKIRLVLDRIAEEEKIEISRDELQQAFVQAMYGSGMKPKQFAKELKEKPEVQQNIRHDVLMQKTVEMIIDNATIQEISREEAEAQQAAAQAASQAQQAATQGAEKAEAPEDQPKTDEDK